MNPRILLFTVAALLASSVSFAQLVIPSETPLTEPQYGPAAGDQFAPVVATNGTDFLVAWLDGRGPLLEIYANRVQRDGRILDGTGLGITIGDAATANGRLLGLFRMAGAYVLVYHAQRFSQSGSSYETYVARIGDDGQLLDAPHLVLVNPFIRAAASNGSRIVLAGESSLAVLDDRGALLERDIALPLPSAYIIGIASNGATFLLVTYSFV